MKWPSQAGISVHPWNAVPDIAPAEPTWALMPGGQRWALPWNLHFSFSSSSVCDTARAAETKTHLLVLVSCQRASSPKCSSCLDKTDPLVKTDSAILECYQSIFFLGSSPWFFFIILCFVLSTHGLFRSPLVLFWYRIFLSGEFADVEVNGSQWSSRNRLPSCADPVARIKTQIPYKFLELP